MSEEQLIKKCQLKDRRAQEQLFKTYQSKLFAIALKYSRNWDEAQDHLQDAFLTIFDKITQFNFEGAFEGWMRRIAINTVLAKYRENKKLHLMIDPPTDIEEDDLYIENEDEISIEYLLSLIQQLPDRYRMVFNLYVLDGFSHQEIAEMMGINEGTSKSNLSRARSLLQEKLENRERRNNRLIAL